MTCNGERELNVSQSFDARGFRDALSSFATGVTIVTARDLDGSPIGMTASSFNSVSVDPPLVLWSVAKKALSAPAFKAADHWVVQILASDQVALSNRFAASGTDKFSETEYRDNAEGVPVLSGCAACFECRSWKKVDGGDHWILIGEVLRIDRQPRIPLVFCGGSYATFEPIRPAAIDAIDSSDNANADVAHDAERIEDLLIYQLARATRQVSGLFHQRVSDSGLTIPEWRVLASLHGPVVRDIDELSVRTFIDLTTLSDMVHAMAEQNLCTIHPSVASVKIAGTQKGHDRVSHLFDEGAAIETKALGESDGDDANQLKSLLRKIVRNTN